MHLNLHNNPLLLNISIVLIFSGFVCHSLLYMSLFPKDIFVKVEFLAKDNAHLKNDFDICF